MRVKYIGQGDENPPAITLFGVTFPLGKFVEYDGPEAGLRKLQGNSHFIVGEEQAKAHTDALKRAALEKARAVKAEQNGNGPDDNGEHA